MNVSEQNNKSGVSEGTINLIEIIYSIYRHRKVLVLFCLFCMLTAGIASYFMPSIYSATAILLLENKGDGPSGELKAAFLSQFGVAGLEEVDAGKSEVFLAILKSKELSGEVLRRYHYLHRMGIDLQNIDASALSFSKTVKVSKSKSQPTIDIIMEGKDPVLLADLVNSYAVSLDKFNRMYTITSAQHLRKYIESRLMSANKELDEVQNELRKFQEQSRAISISRQAEATLTVLSGLEAQRVSLEVEKAAKEKFFGRPHMEIELLNAKMGAIQRNINHLTYANGSSVPIENEKGKVEFYIPLTMIPGLNFDESKLLLNIKAKTNVVTMLTTQLEQAKLEEAKDISTINLLEAAKPPATPIKPNPKQIIFVAGFVGFFAGLFIIFTMEWIKRIDLTPENSTKWHDMKKGILSAIFVFKQNKSVQYWLAKIAVRWPVKRETGRKNK
ncbi:MAG: hypothetical protein EHM45_07510 [Desulfobacteraceae bacterium]|nr:MAG: hypothetical protein EHM45_07510 [Desulfobacteraceae bacterium]